MTELGEREQQILTILIRSFVQDAEPVSSRYISRRLNSSLSPATIRNSLSLLEKRGYISQPYTSAGRLPTRKGYRFFVDSILSHLKYHNEIDGGSLLSEQWARRMQQKIANSYHLVVGFLDNESEPAYTGFEELFQKPEFMNHETVVEFGKFIDGLESNASLYTESMINTRLSVFIGEENPIQRLRGVSVILRGLPHQRIFFAAGPLRMDYERIIKAFFEF